MFSGVAAVRGRRADSDESEKSGPLLVGVDLAGGGEAGGKPVREAARHFRCRFLSANVISTVNYGWQDFPA